MSRTRPAGPSKKRVSFAPFGNADPHFLLGHWTNFRMSSAALSVWRHAGLFLSRTARRPGLRFGKFADNSRAPATVFGRANAPLVRREGTP